MTWIGERHWTNGSRWDAKRIASLEAALEVVLVAESLDQAQGIAHAALAGETYRVGPGDHS